MGVTKQCSRPLPPTLTHSHPLSLTLTHSHPLRRVQQIRPTINVSLVLPAHNNLLFKNEVLFDVYDKHLTVLKHVGHNISYIFSIGKKSRCVYLY